MTRRLLPLAALVLLAGISPRASAQIVIRSNNASRDCTTCHVEWNDSFDKPKSHPLIDKPLKALVAEEDTCLGCHDGSVADSRRDVWLDHNHTINKPPTPGMAVPSNLPLQNGNITCRTCHTAHANPGNENITNTIFLRMSNDASQLCLSCHGDKSKGPEVGTHPLGPMKMPAPDEIIAAGGKAGRDDKTLTCQTCHRTHGSRQDYLLVLPTNTSELCQTCHDRIRPEMWAAASHEHPQNPPLSTASQKQAIQDMHTKVGPSDTMICLSCHKLHDGKAGRAMLADTLADSALCIRCHEDREQLANSPHDLRKTAPAELNRLKQTPAQSGPCGACHSFHTYSRTPAPTAAYPSGLCATCHAAGKHAVSFNHPTTLPEKKNLACLTCHNPHDVSRPKFLRASPDQLCAACHAQQATTLAGEHDFTTHPDARNANHLPAAESGKCGFCHDVHRSTGPALWAATPAKPKSPDDLCIQCHRSGGLASKTPASAFSHTTGPRTTPTTQPASGLPLFDEHAHRSNRGFVTCASCHDPHLSRSQSRFLLRAGPDAPTSSLCVQCHPQQQMLAKGPHDAAATTKIWPAHVEVTEQDTCMACHRAHGNDPKSKLWTVTPTAGLDGTDAVCVTCHLANRPATPEDAATLKPTVVAVAIQFSPTSAPARKSESDDGLLPQDIYAKADPRPAIGTTTPAIARPAGPATRPGLLLHPTTFPAGSRIAAASGQLPLLSADSIGCRTCHNPHAAPGTPYLLRTPSSAPPQQLCLTCHNEQQPLAFTPHQIEPPPGVNAANSAACSPCHAVHATPGSVKPLLWAAPLNPTAANESDRRCLGCHTPGSSAKAPPMFEHPPAALESVPYALRARGGNNAPDGNALSPITCLTCHLPHGKQVPNITALANAMRDPKPLVAASKPLLRNDVARTLCTTCHGPDSPRVFLYYHRPAERPGVKRAGNP